MLQNLRVQSYPLPPPTDAAMTKRLALNSARWDGSGDLGQVREHIPSYIHESLLLTSGSPLGLLQLFNNPAQGWLTGSLNRPDTVVDRQTVDL